MTTAGQRKRAILIVDDEDEIRGAICEFLTGEGYDVIDSSGGPDAIVKASQESFDAAILDVMMPEMSGFDLMHVMRRMCPDTVVIMLTAMADPDSRFAGLAKTAGVFDYLTKPCKLADIKDTLERGFAQQQASRDALLATD